MLNGVKQAELGKMGLYMEELVGKGLDRTEWG